MRICPTCKLSIPEDGSSPPSCNACRWTAVIEDGLLHYAPELAEANEDYDADFFMKLFPLEKCNWWFIARNQLIQDAIRSQFPAKGRFLEIGCGTGFVLKGIATTFPDLELYATEIYSEGLRIASERVPQATFFQVDARRLPYRDHFDLIGAFDVVEHIDEDEVVLKEFHDSVKPGGGLILTVPQHMFLWSEYDKQSCHKRRYERAALVAKVEKAGFELCSVTSFVSLLLPVLIASRWWKRLRANTDSMDEFAIGPVSNAILGSVMSYERFLISRWGLSFPVGGSLLLVARRPGVLETVK